MKLVLDTNTIIDFLGNKTTVIDLVPIVLQHECFISVITKLELLKYPEITPEEEKLIYDFLQIVPQVPINDAVENETIAISRATKLKLPDAIIAATTIVYSAELVTNDTHFLNCPYPKLHVWTNADNSL